MENKFVNISESKDIDIAILIQTLKEIKQLHELFEEISIKAKENYTQIQFSCEFAFCKKATLDLELKDKNAWIVQSHNFPQNCMKIGSILTLKNAAENFLLVGNNLFAFFRAIESLKSSSCQILEPVEGERETATYRLIKYSKFISIKVTFNPMNIREMHVKFYGKSAENLEDTYNKYSEKMKTNDEEQDDDDEEFDVYRDLCTKLDVLEFPAKLEEVEDECAICLCHENEFNQLPFICCDNPRCDCLFHATCLSKHLNLKGTKILSTLIMGDCPFCKHKISSNFVNFL